MKSTDPVAILGGEDRYAEAGGKIDRDLFSDSGDKWVNPEIAQRLAADIMEAEAKRIGEELGLAWIRPIASNYTHSRSEEHTSELQSLMRISYAVFCLKKKKKSQTNPHVKHTKKTSN